MIWAPVPVHVDGRIDFRGQGLQRLGAANFTAIDGDGRVVRHVLGLEGTHFEAAQCVGARKASAQKRFADI